MSPESRQQARPQIFIHGSKLESKARRGNGLDEAWEAYEHWRSQSLAIRGRTRSDVAVLTALLNDYKNTVEPIFDARPNSAQEVLQPSILEEFFEYLFCEIANETGGEPLRRPSRGYIGLVFNPKDMSSLLTAPEYTIRRKDHDFVIGAEVEISIGAEKSGERLSDALVVPAIAIECKRYLERNMLDECSGTAEKVKRATPYCKYIIVAEFLKMDDASPEVSLIDEIYILRKQRNSDRLAPGFTPNPISDELVWDIYHRCVSHLKKIWWNPRAGVETGKMFNFSE